MRTDFYPEWLYEIVNHPDEYQHIGVIMVSAGIGMLIAAVIYLIVS